MLPEGKKLLHEADEEVQGLKNQIAQLTAENAKILEVIEQLQLEDP